MSNLDPSKLVEATAIVLKTDRKDHLSEKEVADRKEVRRILESCNRPMNSDLIKAESVLFDEYESIDVYSLLLDMQRD